MNTFVPVPSRVDVLPTLIVAVASVPSPTADRSVTVMFVSVTQLLPTFARKDSCVASARPTPVKVMLTLVAPLAALAGLTLVITGPHEDVTTGLAWSAAGDSAKAALTFEPIAKVVAGSPSAALTVAVRFWLSPWRSPSTTGPRHGSR